MRLLLDSPFPEFTTAYSEPDFQLDRWRGKLLSDEQLVRQAHEDGYDGVALMGEASLSQGRLIATAEALGLLVVVAATDDPIRASGYMHEHLTRVRNEAAPGRVLALFSRLVRVYEPGQLSSRS
jgi:hypothetical protein